MEIIHILQKNIENIQNEVKDVNRKLDEVNKRLSDYVNKKYKCAIDFDIRYVKLHEFKNLFQKELDYCQQQKLNKLHKGTELIRNIILILHSISPFVISFIAYLILKK